jgi:hypothetical protein
VVHKLDDADLAVVDQGRIELDEVVVDHVVHLSSDLRGRVSEEWDSRFVC